MNLFFDPYSIFSLLVILDLMCFAAVSGTVV